MGKVLIEKILRSCPDISTIYLIVRSKKGKKPNERLDDIINCPVSTILFEICNNSIDVIIIFFDTHVYQLLKTFL